MSTSIRISGSSDNLFTANLTLAANRTHDLNGNILTFNTNGGSVGIGAVGLNLAALRVNGNNSKTYPLYVDSSSPSTFANICSAVNTANVRIAMYVPNVGYEAGYVAENGTTGNTSAVIGYKAGFFESNTNTNFGFYGVVPNVGTGNAIQFYANCQSTDDYSFYSQAGENYFRATNGNSGERTLGLRNHTNTGWLAEFRNDNNIYFGNTGNSQTFVRTYGSAGAYNQVIHNNGGTVTHFSEGSGFQGVQYSGIYMFTTQYNGGGVNGVIDGSGNWFIMANPYYYAGYEPSVRFNIISKGITEASGSVFKLKHLDTVPEAISFTSFHSTNDGYILQRINTSAIADARLENSQFSFSIDEVTDIVTMKIKKSNGTVITKTLI